jgi:hypothetical protein
MYSGTRASGLALGGEIATHRRVPSAERRCPTRYQLLFFTPGMSPSRLISRKQIRQIPNFRRNARERPHRWQRLCCRTPNFGFRFDFSIIALRAIAQTLSVCAPAHADTRTGLSSPRNGIPSSRSSANARLSCSVVVTNVMSSPWICSTRS